VCVCVYVYVYVCVCVCMCDRIGQSRRPRLAYHKHHQEDSKQTRVENTRKGSSPLSLHVHISGQMSVPADTCDVQENKKVAHSELQRRG
jgi:hypothetical protein